MNETSIPTFSLLIEALDNTNKTNEKVNALANYFTTATDSDAIWALALLSGKRPKRPIQSSKLRIWAAIATDIPHWLFEESYRVTGDLAETIALLVSSVQVSSSATLADWMDTTLQLGKMDEESQMNAVTQVWRSMGYYDCFVFNKLITGSFRIGVSAKLVIKALHKVYSIPENQIAHRLMGQWAPHTTDMRTLMQPGSTQDDISRPYPFLLAYAIEATPEVLGPPEKWQAEWKWDGIRGQIIVRQGELFIWSRGEELMNEKFPELEPLKSYLPEGTVLDGEILVTEDGKPQPFQVLQTRIGRKNISKALLANTPISFFAYDVLEWEGIDYRSTPLQDRRQLLEKIVTQINQPKLLTISPKVPFTTWEELAQLREGARSMRSEGFMLKNVDSIYETGRKRGLWWKWKTDPLSIDGVLIYAQQGHGRRANLYTDYTFAVWDQDKLVPFAKAYSGLTDKELLEVDRYIKKNTKEKFGPVRSVTPELVFEIGFEGIQRSPRHKSGIALRFPRILRWRKDKKIEEADTLETLAALIH